MGLSWRIDPQAAPSTPRGRPPRCARARPEHRRGGVGVRANGVWWLGGERRGGRGTEGCFSSARPEQVRKRLATRENGKRTARGREEAKNGPTRSDRPPWVNVGPYDVASKWVTEHLQRRVQAAPHRSCCSTLSTAGVPRFTPRRGYPTCSGKTYDSDEWCSPPQIEIIRVSEVFNPIVNNAPWTWCHWPASPGPGWGSQERCGPNPR